MSSYACAASLITEPIVISGMAGRFPESDSTDEFAQNLYNNVDVMSEDDRRWPTGTFGMNHRMGKIKDINRLDGSFFGILKQLGDTVDPQSRILLETTYEAIIDAGINPQTLRGTKTGVYIGYSSFAMPDGIPEDIHPDSLAEGTLAEGMLDHQGQGKCLYANRISFIYDFKGPSVVTDTACSSSLFAFYLALNEMRLGKCDQAIVGATQICLQPFSNQVFQIAGGNAADGIPRVWDENASGYTRGETVTCLLLQRKSEAKRIYATALNAGVNIDGNKKMGMFFPSTETQQQLMVEVFKEANVDPLDVKYIEAHGTGTKAGDTQEAKAIYNAYCSTGQREEPLTVGLLKSIIGHCEGASGAPSLIKVLLAYENQRICANLHLDNLKKKIKPFCPPLLPTKENMEYVPGIAAVNNFGIGGVNAHALLEPNYKTLTEDNLKIADTIPRIVNICGRTESAFNEMCKWIEENPEKVNRDFLALLAQTMRVEPSINSSGMPYRGSLFIKQLSDNSYEYKKQYSMFTLKAQRPVWFIFPGLGGQWVGMAKALMPIKIFADRIEECHQILKPFGIDLKLILLSDNKESLSSMTNKFCATTAIEIALMDVITELGIIPDGIMGHSFGEIAAAYADGCLTVEEALLVTYFRGVVTESDKEIPKGLMAVIGVSWAEAQKVCGQGVQVVCNNEKETVVISGLEKETKELVKQFEEKGVFVHILESHGIPYHSRYINTSAEKLTKNLKKYLTQPKLWSQKWISTAIIDSDFKEELTYASAEYFVHNLISPVYFYNTLPKIPEDAIVIEIGPHGLFSKVVKEVVKSGDYISLIKKNSNDTNLEMFLTSIGKLYELGLNPIIENLYPKVEWPVARGTQSISSLMRWDHSEVYFTRKYPDNCFRPTASDMNVTINLSQSFKSCLPDHCIDGHVLYPGVGYLMLAWKRMAAFYAKTWKEVPVMFEDIQFRRPIFLSDTDVTKIKVKYLDKTSDFIIEESGNVCCYGKIKTTDEYMLNVQHLIPDQNAVKDKEFEINFTANDIYKDLRILGYDYGPKFRRLLSIKTNDLDTCYGQIEWDGNWMTFVDSIIQSMCISMTTRKMMVPVMIKSLRCDPKILFEAIVANRVIEEKELVDVDTKIDQVESIDTTEKDLEEEWDNFEDKQQKVEDLVDQRFKDEYHIYKAVLPLYTNMTSRLLVTLGIEIEDLIGLPIPRKFTSQDLKLESYEFIANEDSNAIEECDRHSLLEYIKVCSSLEHKIKDKLKLNKTNTKIKVSEDLMNKYLLDIKDEHILLKTLNDLYNKDLSENLNNNIYSLHDLVKESDFDLDFDVLNQVSKNERLIRTLLDIVSENNVPKRELKVLEINTTKCLLAEEVDSHLASYHIYPIDVNYTIVVKTKEGISDEIKKKSFKLIEWEANERTVFPSDVNNADLIVFRDSTDLWEIDIEKQLQEKYDTLTESGFLLSLFKYKLTEPELALSKLKGDLMKRITDYVMKAKSLGFTLICQKSDSIGWMSFLFRKMFNKPIIHKNDNIIQIKSNSVEWFETIKEKLIEVKESEEKENVWLIANDSEINGIIGLINCLRLEPGGETLRCLFDFDNLIKFPLNFKEKLLNNILSNDLVINVLKNGKIGTYRHLILPKGYDKTESNEYFLNTSQNSLDLSSLQWIDSRSLVSPKHFFSFEKDDGHTKVVECIIYSAGLNFKDVMVATGRVSFGIMMLFTDCMLGSDFAGRRADTGERVMGFALNRAFGTNVVTREDFLIPIPDNWSMDEAVTLLSTYSTVWYGLIERANIKKGESVLIHSGAGGVGQTAILVCQHYSCNIFTTVGNEDKKKYLMEKFNIPENRIFSSRNIEFKYKIKEITRGKGVDIVLNSLAGEKLDAGFDSLAEGGRFVEIGKFDLQMNKQLGMIAFLRNIAFIGISLDSMFFKRDIASNFSKWLLDNSKNGMIKPLDTVVFPIEETKNAFKYMTTGKHMGKIVLRIRDEEKEKHFINNFNPSKKMIVNTKTYFNPNKVYIITGGLGGFGLEMIHWMIFLGARKFVLTSRYGVKTDYQKFILKRLETTGEKFQYFETKIVVSTQETDTIEGAKKLIIDSQKIGPIGGIFHLALVLNDCLLENQTIDKFCETIDSKSKSFENLDKITRDLNIDLDYFVVFSSVTCGKGNAGQSNYGYANSICERICEARRKVGLHALAIQWGPIGDVGVMADNELNTTLASIVKQRINSCLEIMDKLLQTNKSIVSSVIRSQRTQLSGTKESKLVNQLWQALGIDPKTTPNHLTLGEIGMESMFSVELQQGLEREYDLKVTLNDIKNITIGMMKDFEAGKVDELKKFSKEVQQFRNRLSKVKFIIPSESTIKLNDVVSGQPIYFLPPLEGIFASLESLAQKVNRPVIGLNWIRDMDKLGSVKEISEYFSNLMKTLEPKGNYDMVGHFFGGLIVIKMLKKSSIRKAVIIDMMSDLEISEQSVSDEYLIEIILDMITKGIPHSILSRLKREIQTKPDVPSKLAKIAEELKEFVGKSMVSKDLEEILNTSFKRAKLFNTHRLNMKKKFKQKSVIIKKKFLEKRGKLLIIKALDANNTESIDELLDKIKGAYFLPEMGIDEQLDFETVDTTNIEKSFDAIDISISVNLNNYFLKV